MLLSTSESISVVLRIITVPELIDNSHAAVALGKRLFPLFALALDLPEDFFADKVNLPLDFSRYPI